MKLYTIPQVAKIIGRTRQDVWYLVKNNKIKAKKVGKVYVIKEKDLNKYLNKR